MKARGLLLVLFIVFVFRADPLFAAVFHLMNGDRVTGDIVHTNPQDFVVKTETMGIISIQRDSIERKDLEPTLSKPAEKKKPKMWDGKVSVGFDRSRGNTSQTELTGGFLLHAKREKRDEFHLKGDLYYSSESRKMNARKYYGMIRYAYSFGSKKKWYNFFKTEGDHDSFANIKARVTPSSGIGFWFWDRPDLKAMVEGGLGVTFTDYQDDTDDDTELVAIPRVYFEKKIFKEAKVSQEAIAYPSLTDLGEYRLHLDTALISPLSDQLALKVSWVNDYNSDPGSDTKKHDMRLTSSLEYSF